MSHSKTFTVLTIKGSSHDGEPDARSLVDNFVTDSELERQLLLSRCFAARQLEVAR
jgi:hypothetical protein